MGRFSNSFVTIFDIGLESGNQRGWPILQFRLLDLPVDIPQSNQTAISCGHFSLTDKGRSIMKYINIFVFQNLRCMEEMEEMKTWEIWRTRVDQSRPRWRSLIIDQEKRHLASGNPDWYIFECILVSGTKSQETTSIHFSSTDTAGWTGKKNSSWVRLDLLVSGDGSTLSLAFLYFGRQFSVVFLESYIAFAHTV